MTLQNLISSVLIKIKASFDLPDNFPHYLSYQHQITSQGHFNPIGGTVGSQKSDDIKIEKL